MGRQADMTFFCWDWDFAVDGATSESGRLPADAERQGWFPYFPYYREDAQGRLLYLLQLSSSTKVIQDDIAWMRAHPRAHFGEVFDRVTLRDEREDYALIKTLAHVTLLEALEGLVEVLKARDAAARR